MSIFKKESPSAPIEYQKLGDWYVFDSMNLRFHEVQNQGDGDYPIGGEIARLLSTREASSFNEAYRIAKRAYINSLRPNS